MSDKRESFPTHEDIDNENVGINKSSAVEGDTTVGRTFDGSMVAVDEATGQLLKFLRVDDNGALLTNPDSGSSIARLNGRGKVANVQTTETLIASITLQQNFDYTGLECLISCFRDTVARIVAVDDVGVTDVETELVSEIRLGAGQYTFSEIFENIGDFTSGGTGVQELQILAKVLQPAAGSDVAATLGITELQ